MFRSILLSVVAAAISLAAPVDCTTGTLADYLDLPADGCQIGSKSVSAFSLAMVAFGSEEIAPDAVGITPLFDALGDGLLFTYNTAADNARILESAVLFSVQSSAFGPIGEVSLRLAGTAVTPDGVAVGLTDLCYVAFTSEVCTTSPGSLITFDTGTDAAPLDNLQFSPAAMLAIRHDAVVDAGLSGSAAIVSAELRFHTVPEPSTVTMAIAAMIAGFAAKRCLMRRSHS